jgi:hypothetical protein
MSNMSDPCTRHLTPSTRHPTSGTFFPSPANYLFFQQHSRFLRISTFVFKEIPASFPTFQHRSFVFNDIPASFHHFSNSLWLLRLSSDKTPCHRPRSARRALPRSAPLKGLPVKQWVASTAKKAKPQFIIQHSPLAPATARRSPCCAPYLLTPDT